jgi:hypothetical protein
MYGLNKTMKASFRMANLQAEFRLQDLQSTKNEYFGYSSRIRRELSFTIWRGEDDAEANFNQSADMGRKLIYFAFKYTM